MLFKAHRVERVADHYNYAAPILKTLVVDKNTHRCRDIRKDDEKSLYDAYHSSGTRFVVRNSRGEVMDGVPRSLVYQEADRLEDEVLFPDQFTGEAKNRSVAVKNKLLALEQGRIKNFMRGFANDESDSEYESDDYDSELDDEEWSMDEESSLEGEDAMDRDDKESEEDDEEIDEKTQYETLLFSPKSMYANGSEQKNRRRDLRSQ